MKEVLIPHHRLPRDQQNDANPSALEHLTSAIVTASHMQQSYTATKCMFEVVGAIQVLKVLLKEATEGY